MRVLKLILICLGVDEEGQDADEMNFVVMDKCATKHNIPIRYYLCNHISRV